MTKCIYCNKEKADSSFTLEHAVPQFLGGAFAPDRFKVREVCERCNNILGLFVDGAFAKTWWIANWLNQVALNSYGEDSTTGPPLICMGLSELTPPGLELGEVCEAWHGPLGEQVYLIRPDDERFYWYAGGDPIKAKRVETRAYFLFNSRTLENPKRSWLAFKDAFVGTAVRKIMCTQVEGADPSSIGFFQPDDLDRERISYFHAMCREPSLRKNSIPVNIEYDYRFMSKLALGVSYSLFGEAFLCSPYCDELRKGVWYREGDAAPQIMGVSAFGRSAQPDSKRFLQMTGMVNAVALHINLMKEGAVLTLNIGESLAWSIMCATRDVVDQSCPQELPHGAVVVLYPSLHRGFELSLPEFLNHKSGHRTVPDLAETGALAFRGNAGKVRLDGVDPEPTSTDGKEAP